MTEDYLHLLWRTKRLPFHELTATECDDIEILCVGEYNTASGPDFFNAKIRIDDTIHHGNVELHLNSSDWYKHKHQFDPAYNNVILHVVLFDDKPLEINNVLIPTIELNPFIDQNHLKQYHRHMYGGQFISCENQLATIEPHLFWNQVENALLQRLNRKKRITENLAFNNQNHVKQIIFQQIVKSFGFKTNDLPFLELANRLPFRLCLTSSLKELEVLIFGLAGFLEEPFEDQYHEQLRQEWIFVQQKFQLTSMNAVTWKFKGCRPTGFPTTRIAQLIVFLNKMNWQLEFWELGAKQIIDFLVIQLTQELPEYWMVHYHFGKESKLKQSFSMSVPASHVLILNAVVPFLGWYSDYLGDTKYQRLAIEMLELLPSEKNQIVSNWLKLDKRPKSAAESQGLIELKNEICNNKKCLECKIGLHLLGK